MDADRRYNDDADSDDAESYRYGERRARPFQTAAPFDGQVPTAPRRPEVLGDDADKWWDDLRCWTDWLIATFRLSNRFPPCWQRHPQLVEELMALWLHWQAAWLPGIDPSAPVGFLRELDWAITRVDRLWRPPCTTDSHRSLPDVAPTAAGGSPGTLIWWSNPNYLESDTDREDASDDSQPPLTNAHARSTTVDETRRALRHDGRQIELD